MKKKIIFIFLFAVIGLITLQIPFTKIVGSNQTFTLFDFIAPTSGLLLSSYPGAISVFLVKIFDLVFVKHQVDLVGLLRLLPLPLAAYYFGAETKKKGFIALGCMFLFVLHPIGRQAWIYSLYWLIPLLASFFPKRLFLRSLGSTFTAHAVGSTVFLYSFGLTPLVWKSLIPVVFMERIQFTLGIYLSYFLFNLLLNYLGRLSKASIINSLVKREYLPSKEFLFKFS